jgi:hypothetical protein
MPGISGKIVHACRTPVSTGDEDIVVTEECRKGYECSRPEDGRDRNRSCHGPSKRILMMLGRMRK